MAVWASPHNHYVANHRMQYNYHHYCWLIRRQWCNNSSNEGLQPNDCRPSISLVHKVRLCFHATIINRLIQSLRSFHPNRSRFVPTWKTIETFQLLQRTHIYYHMERVTCLLRPHHWYSTLDVIDRTGLKKGKVSTHHRHQFLLIGPIYTIFRINQTPTHPTKWTVSRNLCAIAKLYNLYIHLTWFVFVIILEKRKNTLKVCIYHAGHCYYWHLDKIDYWLQQHRYKYTIDPFMDINVQWYVMEFDQIYLRVNSTCFLFRYFC